MHKKITRRAFCSMLLALPFPARAQQPTKIPRIGFLTGSGSGDPSVPGPLSKGFRQGLQGLGYVEGKNIQVEYRSAQGKPERIPGLVAELVQLNVDVLVVTSSGILAAKQATKTIPIVMVTNVDPVATGLIDSLAHPGGNITGLTTLAYELSGKRLELLTEMIPRLSRVGALWDADSRTAVTAFKEYEVAARALKIQLQSLEVGTSNVNFEGAFQAAVKGRAGALIAIRSTLTVHNRKRIANLASKNRLPSMYEESEFVEGGGLVSYSSDDAENYRRVAAFVDKILKGRTPQDLPVEQPMKFDFVINLKAAKAIGLTIPPNVLVRANKVIR